jgi:hypothetical protein
MSGRESSSKLSLALLEAQERLEYLRNKIATEKNAPDSAAAFGRRAAQNTGRKEAALSVADVPLEIAALPAHLGWHSLAVTAAVRNDQRRRAASEPQNDDLTPGRATITAPRLPKTASDPAPKHPLREHPGPTVKLYPDIALGMLRQGETATGRIWLLLHYLDQEGRGWLRIDITRHQLTTKTSKLRICGWRQLRKLLNKGEGVFWTRDSDRLWLRSAAKVAAALGVGRLTGKPAATPVAGLLQGIGGVRAHLYASFHSGRAKTSTPGPGGMPVARATLEWLTGACRRSQPSSPKPLAWGRSR